MTTVLMLLLALSLLTTIACTVSAAWVVHRITARR